MSRLNAGRSGSWKDFGPPLPPPPPGSPRKRSSDMDMESDAVNMSQKSMSPPPAPPVTIMNGSDYSPKKRKSSRRRSRDRSRTPKRRSRSRTPKSSRRSSRRKRSRSPRKSSRTPKRSRSPKKSRSPKRRFTGIHSDSRSPPRRRSERKKSRSKTPKRKSVTPKRRSVSKSPESNKYIDNYDDFKEQEPKSDEPKKTQTEVQKFFEARKKLKEITKALSPKVSSPKSSKKVREPIKITIGANKGLGKKKVEVADKDSDEDFGPALPPVAESTPAPSKKDRPKKLRNAEAEMDMFATDDKNEDDPFSSFGTKSNESPAKKSVVKEEVKMPSPVPKPVVKPVSDFAELTKQSSSSSSSSSSSDSSSDSSSSNEESAAKPPTKPDSEAEKPKLTKTQEYLFLDDEEDSGEDNYDPANCIHSDSDEKTLPNVTGLEDTKSGSSIVMSPVTPPTPDEDKTLVIDEPPEPNQTEPKLNGKPQAVVQPMNSDTSPLSSEEPQRNQQINDSNPAMQSVLQTLQQRQAPPQAPPLLAALTGQAPLNQLNNELLNVVRNINPEPNVEVNQAAMVLRNLAEIGKLLPGAQPLAPPVMPPAQQAPVVQASTPPGSPSPRPRRSKSRKRTKSQIESEAMNARTKRQTFKKRKDFQKAVVQTAKESIKPFFKARRIDKTEYKKIMRDLVRKVVNTSKTYTMDPDKIARLVEKYVNRYNNKPSAGKKKKEEMLDFFNEKKIRSPDSPDSTNSISDIIESVSKSSRPVLTIPELPLPPPPPKQPPPRQFSSSKRHY